MSKELTNKLRAFFTNYAKDAEEYYVDGYYDGGDAPILQSLEDFGKQCFEAALENKKLYNPEKDGSLIMITIIPEYKTYEDYLKSL